MADGFQTTATSIVALIELSKVYIRYRHADETVQRMKVRAKEVRQLLEHIRRTLQPLQPLVDGKSQQDNTAATVRTLRKVVQRFEERIRKGTHDLFGEDPSTAKAKLKRRTKIAIRTDKVQALDNELSSEQTTLNIYLSLLQLQRHNLYLTHGNNAHFQSMWQGTGDDFLLETMRLHELLRNAARAFESSVDSHSSKGLERVETCASNQSSTDRDSHHDGIDPILQSQQDASATLEAFYKGEAGESLTPPLTDSEDLLPSFDTSEEKPYDRGVLQEMHKRLTIKVKKAQEAGKWRKAASALEKLLSTQKQLATVHGDHFEDEMEQEEALVRIFIRLSRWDDALQRIEKLERRTRKEGSASDVPNLKEALDEAHRDQLRALVYLDKHAKSVNREVRLASEDVRNARSSARKAYDVHCREVERSADSYAIDRCKVSTTLLVTSLRILHEQLEADSFLAVAERICGDMPSMHIAEPPPPEEDNDSDAAESQSGVNDDGESQQMESPSSQRRSPGSGSGVAIDWGNPDLVMALREGLFNDIRDYLETHESINVQGKDANGWTALHHFAYSAPEDLVRLLIPHAKDDTRNDKRETALLVAVQNANAGAIKALAEHERFIAARFDDEGTHVLHRSIYSDDTIATEALLSTESGRSLIDVPDIAGMTALHFSCSLGRVDQVEQILAHRSKETIKLSNRQGMTALDVLLEEKPPRTSKIVGLILQKDSKAPCMDKLKSTLERYASKDRQDSAREVENARSSSSSSR